MPVTSAGSKSLYEMVGKLTSATFTKPLPEVVDLSTSNCSVKEPLLQFSNMAPYVNTVPAKLVGTAGIGSDAFRVYTVVSVRSGY